MPLKILITLCLSLVINAMPSASLAENTSLLIDRYSEQRQSYLEFVELLRQGDIDVVKSRLSELENYPLADYLNYLLLKKEIDQHSAPATILQQVEQMQHDQRLHRKLLSAVKNRSAKLGLWKDYQQASIGDNTPVHPCDDLMSSLKSGGPIQFTTASGELWADLAKHTKRCDAAFEILLSENAGIPTRALWKRSVALVKRGDLDAAEKLLKYFNTRDRQTVQAWMDGRDTPELLLPSQAMLGDTNHHQEMATFLFKRWARKDLVVAVNFWRDNASQFGFASKQIEETLAEYAVLAAKRGLPEAAAILDQVTADRDVRYWRVRLALQAGDWGRCLVLLDDLTDEESAETRWQYWRGRCLESQGFKAAAQKVYSGVSGKFDYYGFLAADRLESNYAFNMNRPLVKVSQLEALRESPEIARAIEYFLVGVSWEGRREWNQALKSATKDKYIAAAQVAQSVGWHDRALAAMVSARERGALEFLFPAPFEGYVKTTAEQYSVEREFIYGVMRRESLFIADIKSSAGAVGLMQLMPATAKQMGQQLGIKAPAWKLIEGDLNIKLGVKYLSYLLGRFNNNMVLTAAAYNAGPSRVNKWTDDKTTAADIWVETIPFDETRTYVKAVLFNTIVSQWLLNDGAVTRLNLRMPELTPKGS